MRGFRDRLSCSKLYRGKPQFNFVRNYRVVSDGDVYERSMAC